MTDLQAPPTGRVDMGRQANGERFTLPEPGHGLLHLLVSGQTGSGKSSTVAKLIGDLALNPNIAFEGIDRKGGLELFPWEPRFTSIAATDDECDEVLARLLDEIPRRAQTIRTESKKRGYSLRKWEPEMGPSILFVVDEAAEMDYNKTAIQALASIAARGRALGIHIVMSTQYALANMFPTALLVNLTGRVCHRMGTLTQYATALGVDQAEAREAGVTAIDDEPGVCYVTGVEGVPRFMRCRSDFVPDEGIDRRAAATAHLRWDIENLYR